MMSATQSLSIVVPVFNEQETLPHTIAALRTTFASLPGFTVELLFVNDGSTDRSQAILAEACRAQGAAGPLTMRTIEFSRNFGHSAAVLAGLSEATGDYIGIIDADLQDPPAVLKEMLSVLQKENCDVVYGQRTRREGETLFKRASAWVFYRLLQVLVGFPLPADTGDFRVMTRQVKEAVLECREQEPFLRALISWVGFQQRAYPYVRVARKHGSTQYSPKKMARFASLALISFSTTPLLFAVYCGLLGLLLSVGVAAWVLISWMNHQTIPGWASALLLTTFFQSSILFLVGVQGIYVGRTLVETQNRPRFIVKSRC